MLVPQERVGDARHGLHLRLRSGPVPRRLDRVVDEGGEVLSDPITHRRLQSSRPRFPIRLSMFRSPNRIRDGMAECPRIVLCSEVSDCKEVVILAKLLSTRPLRKG